MGEWRGITNRRGGATSSTRERRIGLSSRSLLRGRRKAGSQLGRGIQVENGHDGREGEPGDVLLRPAAILLYLDKGDQLICIAQDVKKDPQPELDTCGNRLLPSAGR